MARPTKPIEEKAAKGTLRKSRIMPTPPPRIPGKPAVPSHLKGDARAFFLRVTDLLEKRAQLSADSFESLVAVSEVYGERCRHLRNLNAKGWTTTVKATNGEMVEKPRPAVAMYQSADIRFRAWLVEFGLTDASRGKVNADPARLPAPKGAGKQPASEEPPADPAQRYGIH